MNERIKELAEQAGCKVMDDGIWYIPSATGFEKIVYTKGIGLEKFAELIVEECRTVINDLYHKTPLELCGPLLTADEEIAQHFYGVKE